MPSRHVWIWVVYSLLHGVWVVPDKTANAWHQLTVHAEEGQTDRQSFSPIRRREPITRVEAAMQENKLRGTVC